MTIIYKKNPPSSYNKRTLAEKISEQPLLLSIGHYQSHYRFLRLFSLCTALLLAASIDLTNPLTTITVAGALFIYSLVSYKLINTPQRALYLALLAIDGILIAMAIGQLAYNPWAIFFVITTLYFGVLLSGNSADLIGTSIGIAIGVVISFFVINNQHFIFSGYLWGNLCLGSGSFIYFFAYASQRKKIDTATQENWGILTEELREQKVRIYEISRYIPKAAWDKIDGKQRAKIQRKPITIFFSDIVGFSSLSEQLEPETLSNVLSSYLAEMSKVVEQFNGTIDKFIGDAIMVTFGDDDSASKGVKNDAIACVSMALAMKKRMHELQASWSEMGIKETLEIRMGINSGYCTVGTFGISKHLDHTALGVHVNLASRLESAGQPGEILVSYETWSLVNDTILCKDKGEIKAKGFTHPVQVYQVINHRKELGSNQSYFSQTIEGFSIHLDLQKVQNYDREKVMQSLETAVKKLKKKTFQKPQ